MEPWHCETPDCDIRTASFSGPFYRNIEPSAELAHVFSGPRIHYRLTKGNTGRNEDGTVDVVMVSRAKLRDEDGFEYYVRDEEMPFDEDRFHEFKGHRSLAADECPKFSQSYEFDQLDSTRKPVSNTLNAFVNSPGGGTVYLGVLDNGSICGMLLTDYQKDHIEGNLKDLFSRYDVPVPNLRWALRFVPVVQRDRLEEDVRFVKAVQHLSRSSRKNYQRQDIHVFRQENYCWCDKEAEEVLRKQSGVPPFSYVVEIEIFPKVKKSEEDFATLYADEFGKVFFRRNASNARPMVEEIVHCLRNEVDELYRAIQRELKAKINNL